MTQTTDSTFSERLWPSPWLLFALLLLLPAVTLTITPISEVAAVPIAIAVYAIIAGSLLLMSPVIQITDGELIAGRARIPLQQLGEMQQLNETSLRQVIGPGADARAYLLVRGHIHRGVRVEIVDPSDPTPYWVLTTRRPQALAAAIEAATRV